MSFKFFLFKIPLYVWVKTHYREGGGGAFLALFQHFVQKQFLKKKFNLIFDFIFFLCWEKKFAGGGGGGHFGHFHDMYVKNIFAKNIAFNFGFHF